MFRHTRTLIGIALLASLLVVLSVVQAEGEPAGPLRQTDTKVIFTVDEKNDQITMLISPGYTGNAQDQTWIIPLPAEPLSVEFLDLGPIRAVDSATEVTLYPPRNYCVLSQDMTPGRFPIDDDIEWEAEITDYATISPTSGTPVIEQLRTADYTVNVDAEPTLQAYADEGVSFLALKLAQPQIRYRRWRLPIISVTYQGDPDALRLPIQPLIPLEGNAMPITVWIFADTPYAPANLANPIVDFSEINAGRMQVANIGKIFRPMTYWDGLNEYYYPEARTKTLTKHDGRAFVTEFNTPSSEYGAWNWNTYWEESLFAENPYITRLYGELPLDATLPDPVFAPDLDAPDVRARFDLATWFDPLRYHGCTTELLYSDETRAALPTEHAHLDDLHLDLVHPPGWELSTINADYYFDPNQSQEVYVLAPQPVTEADISAFFWGQTAPPMIYVMEINRNYNNWPNPEPFWSDYGTAGILFQGTFLSVRDSMFMTQGGGWTANLRYWPGDLLECEPHRSIIVYGVMATGPDWDEHGDTLRAMSAYAGNYQYYDRAEMPHTLFLKNFWQDPDCPIDFVASIPYPADWTARMDGTGTITIAPVDAFENSTIEAGPFVRLEIWDDTDERRERLMVNYTVRDDTEYDVPEDEFEIGPLWRRPEAFRTQDRAGYVGLLQLCDQYIVELSAPRNAFESYDVTLHSIATSIWENMNCPREAYFEGAG